MTDKIKSCPFCGGDNVDVFKYICNFQADEYSVHCNDCHFGLKPAMTEQAAIEAWNTRKPMDRIVEQLEEVSFVETVEEYAEINLLLLDDAIEIVKAGDEE